MSLEADLELSSEEAFLHLFPLHRACRDGDVEALVGLLHRLSEHTAGHLSTEDYRFGWTPLHWAAHYGQLECLMLLVQMGCEVNTVSSRFDQTPTHTAAFGGHSHCVVWLTKAGADVNRQDLTGEAPIHKAARTGSLECIQVLLVAGAEPHVKNACGQTAADLARAQGFADCFQLISSLLQLHGAPGGQSQGSRKRLLGGQEHSRKKRAKADEDQQQEQQQQEQQQQEQEHQQQQQQQQDVCMDCGSLPDESPVFPSPESQSCGSLHVGDGSPDRLGPGPCGPLGAVRRRGG
ncbi:unnamed protein product [Knipowitschia caucasica]|uniref:Ankyrin repeat domain-containing protein 10 n=1 Tax=Knipowitschia caucasica TaxID=637954 RepID=A0AAV2LPP6_KNICA